MRHAAIFYTTCLIMLLSQCTTSDLARVFPSKPVERSFPKESKELGQNVAKELKESIKCLHNAGINYSETNNNDFNIQFFNDYFQQSYIAKKHQLEYSQIRPPKERILSNFETITDLQFDYINKIAYVCSISRSPEDLSKNICDLNYEIDRNIPVAQQPRLYNVTAVLYYGLCAIYDAWYSGYSIHSHGTLDNEYRILTRSETGPSQIWNNCSYLATAWAIALGEPSIVGEIVALAFTAYVAGSMLYYFLGCHGNTSEVNYSIVNYEDMRDSCIERFQDCYSPIPDGCSVCLQYCLLHEGEWPSVETLHCY